jgi:putative AbiEi antitoxin of type IV toxin-antitoxin system/uncharacterized protein DUF559
MPFMRSESCSFIWQPNVVTWNAFTVGGGYELLCIEGRVGRGARFRVGLLVGDMDPQTTPDARLARIAARRHGVVSREQLHAISFSDTMIRDRLASGRLHRLYRGVYSVGHTIIPREGRWLAAVMGCGDGAALSHRSAASLWGIRPSAAARIDITVPRTSGVRSSPAFVVHRPRRPAETTRLDGIPVTTPGQTLADLAMALPRRQLEKALEMAEVVRLHVVVPDEHPGAKRLAEASAHDLGTTTRSPLEDAFLELCDRHGIPRPLVNAVVEGFEVDFCWPDDRLVVETDGFEHHGTRAAFTRDRAKDAQLTVRGWRVLRFTEPQVRGEARSCADVVLAARDAAPAFEAGDGALGLRQGPAEHADPLRDVDLGGVEVGRVVELRLRRPARGQRELGLPELHRVSAASAEQSHLA